VGAWGREFLVGIWRQKGCQVRSWRRVTTGAQHYNKQTRITMKISLDSSRFMHHGSIESTAWKGTAVYVHPRNPRFINPMSAYNYTFTRFQMTLPPVGNFLLRLFAKCQCNKIPPRKRNGGLFLRLRLNFRLDLRGCRRLCLEFDHEFWFRRRR
jgi:hypothetical protein